MTLLFSVNVWGSRPGTNDDCWTGEDFDTKAEALAAFKDNDAGSMAEVNFDSPWLELEGPGICRTRKNPLFAPAPSGDNDWLAEVRREHLMLHGSLDA